MLRKGFIDLRPLRSSTAFRRLWLTSAIGATAGQMMFVAVLYQVWELTGSPIWTGAIGLVRAVPIIIFGVIGGSWSDAMDRRLLLRITAGLQILVAGGLILHSESGSTSVIALLALVSLGAAIGAVDAPARRAYIPALLPRTEVGAGVALQHLSFQAAMLGGPALGGLAIGAWGPGACFAIHAVGLLVSFYGVLRLPATNVPPSGNRRTFSAIAEGLSFIVRKPVLRGSFASDLAATVLSMPIALFPMINEIRFDGDPGTLGLFLSSIAAGGIIAGLTSGWVTRANRPGVVQLAAGAVWGLALGIFGFASPLWLAMGMLVLAGAADTISVVSRGGLVQRDTPDSHRGRVSALEHTVGVAGPEVGNMRAGLLAGATSAAGSLIVGGFASVAVIGWIAWRNRALRTFAVDSFESDDGEDPQAQDR